MTCRGRPGSGPRPHSRRGSLPGPRVSRSQRERRLHKPGTSYIVDILLRYHTYFNLILQTDIIDMLLTELDIYQAT